LTFPSVVISSEVEKPAFPTSEQQVPRLCFAILIGRRNFARNDNGGRAVSLSAILNSVRGR